jgi:CBS domain containing-hemolysin-like protein
VPDRKYSAELLEDMRSNRCHIAILVDEYGGTAGMVTLRDLLEALVGRIDDAPPITDGITPEGDVEADGSVLLDGLMRVEEFEEATGLRLEEESHEGVETLGGLIAATLGRIPGVGEQIGIGGRALRIEARDGRRIATVRLLLTANAH